MEKISLEGLTFYAYHGVHDFERKIGNQFQVDITLYTDLEIPSKSDNIEDTIDYEFVYQVIEEEMDKASHLLEHVAHRIIESLKNRFPNIKQVAIKVSKHNPGIYRKYKKASIFLKK